ncbi:MAG TPA: peptidoglycan DD-metalloendopeptidase family protein [Gemmatimonadota bacterium]
MLAAIVVAAAAPTLAGCGRGTAVRVGTPPGAERTPPTFPRDEAAAPPVPDSSGWGAHVLTVARAPDGAVWVGTFGQGVFVSRDGSGERWDVLRSGDSTAISWDFVNAIAFAPGAVWVGTIGNGWGVSRDGGRTWRNWTYDELGPRWLYVAPGGIAAAGDTVYVATADGLRITADGGATWRDVTEAGGLGSRYLLGLRVEPSAGGTGPPRIRVWHLRGESESSDGGRTWRRGSGAGDAESARAEAARAEEEAAAAAGSGDGAGAALLRRIAEWRRGSFRRYPDPGGEPAVPDARAHFWFRRPIRAADNPHLDQTYTYGSTMGGNFQQHQGVEQNNPEGTPVLAIGDGTVVYAGEAEAGSNTVAIRHDRRLGDSHVFSTYYHNSALTVKAGDRVRAGDVVAHVGSTGRATNDHLHVEIHVAPTADSSAIVDPEQRFPPFTRNPQLWIEPLAGTGVVAGRVFDAAGAPVPGARVYGIVKPHPRETPFSFAETYEDRAHPDPVFGEHFAIGDVPAGEHVLGVEIGGAKVFRKVRVEPGKVTFVEFRPD